MIVVFPFTPRNIAIVSIIPHHLTPITGTSYEDAPLPEGAYTYQIRAIDTYGLQSGPSDTASAVVASIDSSGCFLSVANSFTLFGIAGFLLLAVFVLAIGGIRVLRKKRKGLGLRRPPMATMPLRLIE